MTQLAPDIQGAHYITKLLHIGRFRMAALDQLAADFDSMGGNMSMPTIVRIKSDAEKGDQLDERL
jgi:hypothetical protein